jgi:Glycosyltransferase sugar-binding region containing DXD motif
MIPVRFARRDLMTTFNAFWFGNPLNAFHWACIRSFVSRGHDYRLHVYEPIEVPAGVTLLDANEVLPRDKLFAISNPVTGKPDVGPFSDLFRYKLLLERGGWYVDVDTICLAEDYPDQIRAWSNEREETEGKLVINPAQLCLPKGDPLARELYQRCIAMGTQSALREDWGPNLMSKVVPEMGLPPAVFGTPATFYPIDWVAAVIVALPTFRDYVERQLHSALFAAVYQSFFQYCGIDLTRLPPAGSYLHSLYDRYAADRITGPQYQPEELLDCARSYWSENSTWAPAQLVRSVGVRANELLDRHKRSRSD